MFKKIDDSNISEDDLLDVELQLEKGSTATTYEEHKEQKIALDIQQEMLTGD